MKSGLNISATRLETVRQRRMNRIRRQRAIEVGKPVDVSLKTMALSSAQQREFTDFQFRPHVDRKHRIVTPKRVSMMAAVGLHLLAVLLAAHYVIWPTRLDAYNYKKNVKFVPFYDLCYVGEEHLQPLPPNGPKDPLPAFEWIGCPNLPEPFPHDLVESFVVTIRPYLHLKIEPKYPIEAKRAGKEGRVVLEATIDVDGNAQDIVIKEDKAGFGCARAAIQALKASRFTPAKRGIKSVPFRIAIPYQFKLED